jgi:hypothetical protein
MAAISMACGVRPSAANASSSARVSGHGGPDCGWLPRSWIAAMTSRVPPGAVSCVTLAVACCRTARGSAGAVPGQCLHCDDLGYQIEGPQPRPGRVQQVRAQVADGAARVALPGGPDRGRGDVKGGDGEPEPGQEFGAGAEPAAGYDGPLSLAGQVVALCPLGEQRVRFAAAPWDGHSSRGARGVEAVESPGGVAGGQ